MKLRSRDPSSAMISDIRKSRSDNAATLDVLCIHSCGRMTVAYSVAIRTGETELGAALPGRKNAASKESLVFTGLRYRREPPLRVQQIVHHAQQMVVLSAVYVLK